MPLKIIRQDITKIECDAIVNPTNVHMLPGGGVDAAIHEAAGPELFEFCQRLGGCSVGEAKITPAFRLPCKYVIHTVGPEWGGGLNGERVLLRSCYNEAMSLAIKYGCHSVAFPLISSGLHGYPKDKVLKEASDVIRSFLYRYEIDVYILVYDKTSYSISRELYRDVEEYINNFYVETHRDLYDSFREESYYSDYLENRCCAAPPDKPIMEERDSAPQNAPIMEERRSMRSEARSPSVFSSRRLDKMLKDMDKGFSDTLFYYIDKKGISDVEAYKRSNVSKKTFSKIKCNANYRPSKETAVSFAIGLHLNLDETAHLLSTAGMCLSRANKFDVIIEYFIMSGKYDTIFDVNEVLYQFDQPLLGV